MDSNFWYFCNIEISIVEAAILVRVPDGLLLIKP